MNLYEIRKLLANGASIYDLPIKVTYYARVSTEKYEQLNSLDNQINYYEDKIRSNSKWMFINGYVDEGISGTSTKKRDSFLKMLKDAHAHKFNLILTKEISRFSRNTLDSIKYTQELLSEGIGVFFECDNINTFMPDSELRLTIMASMAQEEVRKLSERVKFGFQRSIKSGHVLGNNAIWGYRKNNCKLVIIPEEAEIVKKIFDLYVNGHIGMCLIGKELFKLGYKSRTNKPFSSSSIKSILTNPKYKGYYCGNKTRVVDYKLKSIIAIDQNEWICYKDELSVPAIVSEEIWNEAQKIIANRSNKLTLKKKSFTNRYSLSGKIICYKHDISYRRKISISSGIKKRKKILWACSNYIKHGTFACDGPLIDDAELKSLLKIFFIFLFKTNAILVDTLIEEYARNLPLLKFNNIIQDKYKIINDLKKKKDILLDLRVSNRINDVEFDDKYKKYDFEIGKIESELEKIVIQIEKVSFLKNNIYNLKHFVLKNFTFSEDDVDELIYLLVDKIYVKKVNDFRNDALLEIYLNVPFCYHFRINYAYKKESFFIFDP